MEFDVVQGSIKTVLLCLIWLSSVSNVSIGTSPYTSVLYSTISKILKQELQYLHTSRWVRCIMCHYLIITYFSDSVYFWYQLFVFFNRCYIIPYIAPTFLLSHGISGLGYVNRAFTPWVRISHIFRGYQWLHRPNDSLTKCVLCQAYDYNDLYIPDVRLWFRFLCSRCILMRFNEFVVVLRHHASWRDLLYRSCVLFWSCSSSCTPVSSCLSASLPYSVEYI